MNFVDKPGAVVVVVEGCYRRAESAVEIAAAGIVVCTVTCTVLAVRLL